VVEAEEVQGLTSMNQKMVAIAVETVAAETAAMAAAKRPPWKQ